ncbi:hypothetical protein X797_006186 [Metarhizium robertsii]|uniref:Uncharacterized protein n=2 Tax=Metarhizium robertsii TaxID=568076 RepID=E9F4X2_METRA|nr:uncharacterized protein MAA_07321 [Metarhizium robertsii ARSEF 23]EFY97304.2 hypothetical protein MAA_07321 [Metarhizium robertsii ARSEF 23]EXV00778.1 hypothetical protein X797_006186 [Metarhizium robertsii]
MAPTNSKANYKTYEAQARMVRAIVAAHPDVKWNYKEIAACYGSDMTEHALNHRFRRLRAQALIIREGRPQGFDMKHLSVEDNMPTAQDAVDKTNIAKYFGQSTADGIQFQFRGIKKDADQLRQTHSSGGDVANCLSLPSGTSTPTRATAAARTPGSRKRPRAEPKPSLSEASGDEEDDWSDRDETPSKRAPKPTPARKTGARKAAVRAGATIAAGAAPDSDSDVVLVKPESQYQSIFGDPAAARAAAAAPSPSTASVAGAFTERATDPVFSTAFGANLYLGSFEEAIEAYGDGEI